MKEPLGDWQKGHDLHRVEGLTFVLRADIYACSLRETGRKSGGREDLLQEVMKEQEGMGSERLVRRTIAETCNHDKLDLERQKCIRVNGG